MSKAPPTSTARCPRCGAPARPDAPTGLCSACLLSVASESVSDSTGEAVTTGLPPMAVDPAPGTAARLLPGQAFGPYRIVRLLGRGGMGEVYEAEQLEQGRRVALKVLNQRLTDPNDRARFLREGQLAASISHPNSVYIFGSEDIAGTPVIAMELLAGGTLKDRVGEHGPLAPAAAVDAILQVVAGLDAAYAGGILHRDVKPANCFTDRDGTVKVGDFGLSIPTEVRDTTLLTRTGAFQGTPQFAPPERLKGVPQDVRADIYAVGATLYYLLTGQPPFDDANLMALVTQIATETPRSPREIVRAVPRGLSAIVMRCLAKNRESRPASYAALEKALRPFGSVAPTPATLGLRFVAGVIDQTIWSIPLLPLNMTLAFRSPIGLPWWTGVIGAALIVAYYGTLEGLWGASIGKRMAGLRVTKVDGQPPGLARAFFRAAAFQTPSLIGTLPMLFIGQARLMELVRTTPFGPATPLLFWVPLGLLFSTVRQRNGFAAVHELVSGTRVVRRLERNARSILEANRDPAPVAGTSPQRYGPYSVAGTLGRTDVGELLVGFDPNLRRPVWIHALPPGTPAVAPLVRDLGRPGRLRWLSGARSNDDAWDVYEALEGVPLASLLGAPRPWRLVRPWLPDLAREIDAGLKDGSVAALTIEHVWITRDGYARLLDFCAPGVQPATHLEEAATIESGQTFLASVAERALDGSPDNGSATTAVGSRDQPIRPSTRRDRASRTARGTREPLPLSASATLEMLARRGFATWSEVVARTAALLQGPDRVGRWRRAAPLALCGFVPATSALGFLLTLRLMSQVLTPEVTGLNNGLLKLTSLEQNGSRERAQERAALEVYIANRFRPMITDPQTWTSPVTAAVFGPRRALAERVVAEHPNVSTDELATATAALGPYIQEQERSANFMKDSQWMTSTALFASAALLTVVALLGIVWAFFLRGGLLFRVCGVAVVTRDGKPVSRLRALWRALVAWALVPAAFWLAIIGGVMFRGLADVRGVVAIGVGLLFLAGVIWALVQPTRGLQDRLAGTWLVPR